MFVVIHEYNAKSGEEDAIVALYEEWDRTLRHKAAGCVGCELLHARRDGLRFISVTRYESEKAYRVANQDAEVQAWRRRLASLSEEEPTFTCWQSPC